MRTLEYGLLGVSGRENIDSDEVVRAVKNVFYLKTFNTLHIKLSLDCAFKNTWTEQLFSFGDLITGSISLNFNGKFFTFIQTKC